MFVEGLFIDGFAGGGGASTGIAQAIGRDVDIAINHSPTAIAIHKANHPTADHHCTDIRMPFLPRHATRGRPVAGAWFSPDCKEFSKAKGGPVKDRSIRALCWEVIHWLEQTRPVVGFLENVEEFEYAAPLDSNGVPIADQKGREFKRFVTAIRRLGYRVEWRVLIASHYGAPTSRKRLYMIMRRDGLPIVWPKPTHGAPDSAAVKAGKLLPYRTAAECIDWSIPCPSIFDRKRELADATKRRIAHGVMRYVVNAAKPFIVGTAFTNTRASRVFDPADPLRTATTQPEYGVVDCELAPHITKFHSTGVGSDMANPMPTVTANGQPARPAGATPLGMVGATLIRTGHGEQDKSGKRRGKGHHDLRDPAPTVTSSRDEALGTASLAPIITYGQHGGASRSVDEPHHTVAASKKDTNGLAAATLIKMGNGERDGQAPRALDPAKPLGTVTAKGSQAAAVTAFLSSFHTSNTNGGRADPLQPPKTACAGGQHHAIVAAHIEQANGGPRNTNSAGRAADRPLSTATASGSQQRIVETTLIEEGTLPPDMMARAVRTAAFLVQYYATDGENEAAQSQAADVPLRTVTTKARFAVVTVTIDAVTYVIVDIGLRMLKPRELANAQGFPPDYKLDPIVPVMLRGKLVERPLTIAEQISAIGNSVCPPVARALVAANLPSRAAEDLAA
ncbi:DNA cytosine methyltransferase [Sphingomonas sp.]|uniref:DNA cytosine methyltransferase n=1 Tax=Sphingomonas sp. TaxID=28214 RepID=UPI003BACF323